MSGERIALPARAVRSMLTPSSAGISAPLARNLRGWTGLWVLMLTLTLGARAVLSGLRPGSFRGAPLPWEVAIIVGVLLVISLGLYRYAGSEHASTRSLSNLAMGHMALLTFTVATLETTGLTDGVVPWGVSWNCVVVVLYSLTIRDSLPRTAAASLIGVSWSPIVLGIAEAMGRVAPAHTTYPIMAAHGVVAATLTVLASHIVRRVDRVLAQGHDLGAYHLEERIAKGGMGEIWRARHRWLVRPAAVKVVSRSLLGGDGEDVARLLVRFEREARATANLESPHTVRLFDFGETDDGSFYYAMELLDGIDLQRLVDEYGAIDEARALHVLRQTCASLEEAHALGLVHRDVKPANIVLCRVGLDMDFVKVCDFGLVKWRTVQADRQPLHVTKDGLLVGTPGFMSPEALIGTDQADPRQDVYSVGCVAYWLLTGFPVFEGRTVMDIAIRHATEEPIPPSERGELPVSKELEAIVLDCLSKDPESRPRDAAALRARLNAVEAERPWTQFDARAWWSLHHPTEAAPREERMEEASLRPRRTG